MNEQLSKQIIIIEKQNEEMLQRLDIICQTQNVSKIYSNLIKFTGQQI